jgi:hypothetical protein
MDDVDVSERDTFSQTDPACCRIETHGGTVYWLSNAETDGTRWIIREHLRSSDTNTVVMHKASANGDVDLGDKFRARLKSDVTVGAPFILEFVEKETRILSEPVVEIEVGNVPTMLFDY